MNRIRAGYCCSVNPFNADQISRISLLPDDVEVIVFWTKNPKPLLDSLDELDQRGYRYYFQYTLNGYPKDLEPNLPSLEERIETFRALSEKLGRQKVIWRYDPIILSDKTPADFHTETFARIASELSGFTPRAVISIADEYRAAKGRLSRSNIGYIPNPLDQEKFPEMMRSISKSADENGMEIFSCAEVMDLDEYGIQHGKCIDNEYIRSVFGFDVISKKDKTQRAACGCVASKDIGQYDTCLHGCSYCYATHSGITLEKNLAQHLDDSPSLVGYYDCPEKEKEDPQPSLF